MTNAVVVCACRPAVTLAWIDVDDTTHLLEVDGDGPGTTQVVIGAFDVLEPDPATGEMVSVLPPRPHEEIAVTWAEKAVTQNISREGRTSWIIRCANCGQQAQIGEHQAETLAHDLADGEGATVTTPRGQRRILPLAVLITRLSNIVR